MFNDYLKKYNTDLELIDIDRKYEQVCPTGEFRTSGWHQTTTYKLEYIIKIIKENYNNIIVFADPDIQFFGNIKEQLLIELGEYDIAFRMIMGVYAQVFLYANVMRKH